MPRKRAKRTDPAIRYEQILQFAVTVVARHGFTKLTRDHLASVIGIGSSTIGIYYPRMADLQRAVIRRAYRDKILPVLAHLMVSYPHRFKPELRSEVIAYLNTL